MFMVLSLLIIWSLCISCKADGELSEGPDPPPAEPISCDQCTHVLDNFWQIDGAQLNIQPGDTVCLAGTTSYNSLTFVNIEGTPNDPIIIKNCDGIAFINGSESSVYGIKFQRSHDFKLIGNGGGGKYGIKISTAQGFFLTMQEFTTDFEIANVEIAGSSDIPAYAGIGIKTSPISDCDLFADKTRTAWIMKNIVVRDNYIHDTGGEGMYVGHGWYNGIKENVCDVITYSHSIQNIRIFNNIIENTGLDGLQIKNCDSDVEVYNNIIKGYGLQENGAHDEGLLIGEGTTGKFYNNIIIDGPGNGIHVKGMGNLDIYNNVIIKARNLAFMAASGTQVYRIPDGYYNIFNNTFHTEATSAFVFWDEGGGTRRLMNNIFIAPNAEIFALRGVPIDSSNNVFTKSISYFQFTDFAGNDLSLMSSSPAVDAGVDLSDFGITIDILGTTRPQGSAYDIGAYELKNP